MSHIAETPKYHEAFIHAINGEFPPMVQFRLETDDVEALPYAYLTGIRFSKSGVITIRFTTHKVEIKGRRLEKLFGSLVNHQVIAVRQHAITDVRPPAGECCVDTLVIEENED